MSLEDLDEREACELLDELGREIPKIPQSVYVDSNLVPGCQSRVWVENQLVGNPPTVKIHADSDAFVVKGLIYIVLQMFDGRSPQEIVSTDYVRSFDQMGIGRLILPQRKNGLFSLVKTIRRFAADAVGETELVEPVPQSAPAPLLPPSRSIESVVTEFPILENRLPTGSMPVFLDSGASAQRPRCVIEKMREVQEEYYANAFRGKYYFGQRVDDEIETSRAKVASLIGAARSDEIAFTSGTTMSINLVASAWGSKFLKPGDEVVVTELEHHANFVPWQVLAKRQGATLRFVSINDCGELDHESIQETINDRTAIVAVSSMSNVLGTVTPIKEIVRKAHSHGALVLVDAAQSVPHAQVDVSDTDVDFLAFSAHKLYGPSGVGILYGKHSLLSAMDPFLYGGHMIQTVGRETSTWADPPAKFEAGTLPIVPMIGLGTAVDFVCSVGYDAIAAHERRLLEAAHQRLSSIPGLRIYGPKPDKKGAIVSFTIDGISSEDLAIRLNDRGVFTRHGHHCAMILHERLGVAATTRASFAMYNTASDVGGVGPSRRECHHRAEEVKQSRYILVSFLHTPCAATGMTDQTYRTRFVSTRCGGRP